MEANRYGESGYQEPASKTEKRHNGRFFGDSEI
jgi:hypothetical protein